MRKKVYLICVAGYPNYGDELILNSWLHWLHNNFHEKIDIVIDSIHKNSLYFMIDNELNMNDEVVDCISSYVDEHYTTDYAPNFIYRIRRFVFRKRKLIGNFGKPKEIPFHIFLSNLKKSLPNNNHISKIRESNVIHFLGGGYLNSIWKNRLGLLFVADSIKKMDNRKKLILTGAGLLPLENSVKQDVVAFFKNFDLVQARDQASAEALSIDFGYDDAFLCIEEEVSRYEKTATRNIPDVMVCIQSDLGDKILVDKTIALVKGKINELKSNGLTIGYVEALPHSDNYAFQKLSDIIERKNWFSAKECIKQGLPVKKGQLWFTTRFHHHLVASAAGALGVAISYKPGYYDIKHKSLIDLGTGWHYFSPYSSDSEVGSPLGNPNFMNIAKKISFIKQQQAMDIYNSEKLCH